MLCQFKSLNHQTPQFELSSITYFFLKCISENYPFRCKLNCFEIGLDNPQLDLQILVGSCWILCGSSFPFQTRRRRRHFPVCPGRRNLPPRSGGTIAELLWVVFRTTAWWLFLRKGCENGMKSWGEILNSRFIDLLIGICYIKYE